MMAGMLSKPMDALRRRWFVLLPLATYLVTYAVVFPGIDSPDARYQRSQWATWRFSRQHSVLDTFFLGFVGRNQLWLDNLLQAVLFGLCVAAALEVLRRHARRRWAVAAALVWSLYPLFPAYAVSSTKDVLAAGAMLLLCVQFFEIEDTRAAVLRHPWFLVGFGATLFLVNELRKNNFVPVAAMLVFLLIRHRRQWRRLAASILVFVALAGSWNAYCDQVLHATPSATTEMLGVPLMQVSYVYYRQETGHPQNLPATADAYFRAMRPAARWASNYESQPLVVMSNKVESLTDSDLPEFLRNWTSLCTANPGTCLTAYALFMGSTINPLQKTDDQYSILAAMLHTTKAKAATTRWAPVAHAVFNLGLLTWTLVAAAVLAARRDRRRLLPLFLLPAGIVLSLLAGALGMQLRVMFGAIMLIPFLGALALSAPKRGRGHAEILRDAGDAAGTGESANGPGTDMARGTPDDAAGTSATAPTAGRPDPGSAAAPQDA